METKLSLSLVTRKVLKNSDGDFIVPILRTQLEKYRREQGNPPESLLSSIAYEQTLVSEWLQAQGLGESPYWLSDLQRIIPYLEKNLELLEQAQIAWWFDG